MKSRLLVSSVGLGALAVFGTSACNDPNQTNNILNVIADTLQVFAMTGTPPSFPSAFLASAGAVTRADGSFNFDIAFDIDASNKVVIFPQVSGLPLTGLAQLREALPEVAAKLGPGNVWTPAAERALIERFWRP